MIKQALVLSVMTVFLFLSAGIVLSSDQEKAGPTVQTQTQEQVQIYGSQLMTDDERAEYRAKMRTANTEEVREQIRNEHHKLMQERAAAQGMSLPENPPASRGGGGGSGKGGMGQGSGRGR